MLRSVGGDGRGEGRIEGNEGGSSKAWLIVSLFLALTLGLFFLYFSARVLQLETDVKKTEQLLELREENLRSLLEQKLQAGVTSSTSMTSEQVSSLASQLNARLENMQTKIQNDVFKNINSLLQSLSSTVNTIAISNQIISSASSSASSKRKPRTPWLQRIAAPEECDHVFINEDWKPSRSYSPKKEGDKWIVMTSINGPTKTVEKLCKLEGWKTVIVADLKTPKDWHQDGCVFLSMETQNSLPYKIIRYLPWKSYTRKNIGYLYAIEHGAEWILDTDDDNEPFLQEITILNLDTKLNLLERNDRREDNFLTNVVNPYVYFGRPDIWPRGYPLSAINVSESQRLSKGKMDKTPPRPLIQQGLADLDPDVDAVFRLTRPDALTHVHFDVKDPVIISPGSFCPFNSQNTVFHYDAFWGTIIPSSVTMRVSDIWRGYWVQRLLWDVGGALTFLPATVKQIRNPHDYLVDFEQEIPMYMATENFIKLLIDFEPVNGDGADTLFNRIRKISKEMVRADLFKQHDADTLEAWVQDLEGIGYQMPPLTPAF